MFARLLGAPVDAPDLPAGVFFNETIWYGLVSCLFSYERPRRVYQRAKGWIDRTMAVALGAIGVRLAVDAWQTAAIR